MKLMKRLLILIPVLALLGAAAFWGFSYYQANHGFTPWMADDSFHSWRETALNHQPFYLTAVEGRSAGDHNEWRVRMAPKPEHVKWSWKWFTQLDEKTYADMSDQLINREGYQRIWTQSFTSWSGNRLYQVIFLHLDTGAAAGGG